MKGKPIIVVGGGLAGLMATVQIAERGVPVKLFSICPVKRSHSVCAQGGINGAVNTKGEGDSPGQHCDDTIYGGDFLANQTPVQRMCEAAPEIIYLLDRMGVMFNRTNEGLLDFRRFGGTLYHRTAFAGATTGQQMLYALDERVRSFTVDGLVEEFVSWEFLSALIDRQGRGYGITAINQQTLQIESFTGEAVILATGGLGRIFGKSTNSMLNTGSAASSLYQQGATYANGEFIQVHPTAIPGMDKLRLISESVRGEGGRVWTVRDGKPWYFLEEMYPKYGNLVPRDIATRAIYQVCYEMKLGVGGQNMVYLDVSHLPDDVLREKLGGVLEIYQKFVGEDPYHQPMKIFPGVHYSMGGLWCDFDFMTDVEGVFAAGECNYQFHGANRLGANSLLSCLYDGMTAGLKAVAYAQTSGYAPAPDAAGAAKEQRRQQERFRRIRENRGPENAYQLHEELGQVMNENVTVVRDNARLQTTDETLQSLMERARNIGVHDQSHCSNQDLLFVNNLWNMLVLARVITQGALRRDESRGSHYKPAFPARNDSQWLQTTLARHTDRGPSFRYEDVDLRHIEPRERTYDVA